MAKREWPKDITVGNVSVKVYRVKHASAATGFAYVVAYKHGNQRKLEKFSDPDEALREARVKADQLNAGRIEGASMSQGDRDELQAARQLAGAATVMSALKEWARARDLTGGQVIAAAEAWKARNSAKFARRKVPDVVVEFTRAKTKAGFNVADDHYSAFESIKNDLGDQFIDSVSARALEVWLAKKENAVTRNTYRKRIVSVWRWAQKRGYLPRDVKTEAEQTERARETAPEIGIINSSTWGHVLEFVRTKDPELLATAIAAGFCGLRRNEIHAQTWEDVNLKEKFLRVTKAKRGTPARRLVPLSDAAVEWFVQCSGEHKGVIGDGLTVDKLRKAARGAKIELPENCFRHGFISHRVAQTGNVSETSLEAGNSPQIVHRHYRELVTKVEGEAWFSVKPAKIAELTGMDGKAVAS